MQPCRGSLLRQGKLFDFCYHFSSRWAKAAGLTHEYLRAMEWVLSSFTRNWAILLFFYAVTREGWFVFMGWVLVCSGACGDADCSWHPLSEVGTFWSLFSFSIALRTLVSVTRPSTLPCWSATGKARTRERHIFFIIAPSGIWGLTICTGLLIIHLILIWSVASSIGLRHLENMGRR